MRTEQDQQKSSSGKRKLIRSALTSSVLSRLYHLEGKSLEDIGRLFGCTRMYVMKLARKYDIPLRSLSEAFRLALKTGKLPGQCREVNHKFFSRWTDVMAYVVGYFCADGCLYRDKRSKKAWHIKISSNDRTHLEMLRDVMGSNHAFARNRRQPRLLTIDIFSERMATDLLTLGITERKSLTLQFPNVPQEYLSAFIRGYFDGDGCIYVQSQPQAVRLAIVSGSKDFLVVLREQLESVLSGVRGKLYTVNTGRAYHLRFLRQSDILRIFGFLYPQGEATFCLKRKYEKFRQASVILRKKVQLEN
jgi:hypothetical protein